MAVTIAYLAYMMEQNEPSRPGIAHLDAGDLEGELKKLFIENFPEIVKEEDEDGDMQETKPEHLSLFKGKIWGDVVVGDKAQRDNCFLFVTFEDKIFTKGLKLRKSKHQT